MSLYILIIMYDALMEILVEVSPVSTPSNSVRHECEAKIPRRSVEMMHVSKMSSNYEIVI